MVGVALNCLISYTHISVPFEDVRIRCVHLFQRLVVDETRSVLGDIQLAFLEIFAELPVSRIIRQG